MNQETIEKLGGIVTKVTVSYDAPKTWSDAKDASGNKSGVSSPSGSFGVEADVTVGANLDDLSDAIFAYCKVAATRNLSPDLRAHTVSVVAAADERGPGYTQDGERVEAAGPVPLPQQAEAAAKPEPTRTRVDDDGAEYEYVKVSGLTVQFTPTGKKVGKIKGGKYTKIGVTVWPEVALTVGVNLDELAAGDYQLPALAGKTAVCLMKISDKSGKPYPEKVVEFVE